MRRDTGDNNQLLIQGRILQENKKGYSRQQSALNKVGYRTMRRDTEDSNQLLIQGRIQEDEKGYRRQQSAPNTR